MGAIDYILEWFRSLYANVVAFFAWIFSGAFIADGLAWLLSYLPAAGSGVFGQITGWITSAAGAAAFLFAYINLASYFLNVHLFFILLGVVLVIELLMLFPAVVTC